MTDIDQRINKLLIKDQIGAALFVIALWVAVLFVLLTIRPLAPSAEVYWTITIAAFVVLLFNTVSIIAMIKHYREDRKHIYGLDIHYSDLLKRKDS